MNNTFFFNPLIMADASKPEPVHPNLIGDLAKLNVKRGTFWHELCLRGHTVRFSLQRRGLCVKIDKRKFQPIEEVAKLWHVLPQIG